MAYGDSEDLAKRTASDKVLRTKAFNIAKNPKSDGYQISLASMVYTFSDKKSSSSSIDCGVNQSKQLAETLHKTIVKKTKRRRVYSSFKDNIWGVYLADMQLISKYKEIRFYYVLLIFLVNMLGLFL